MQTQIMKKRANLLDYVILAQELWATCHNTLSVFFIFIYPNLKGTSEVFRSDNDRAKQDPRGRCDHMVTRPKRLQFFFCLFLLHELTNNGYVSKNHNEFGQLMLSWKI